MNTMPIDINRLQAQQSYTDLHQLNSIRQLGHEDQSLALKKIAQQFESMFMQMMLKSMRSANDVFAKDNPLNSFEVGFHRDMLDNQLSLSLSQGNQLGLAEALYRQLQRHYIPESSSSESIHALRDEQGLLDSRRLVTDNPYTIAPARLRQSNDDASLLNQLKTPNDFIEAIAPYAKATAEKMGVDYKVLIAQSALETGWGQHAIRDRHGNHSFNLFNIKADSRWQGHSVNVPTLEYREGIAQKETANFRRYANITDAFADYQQFLQGPRYQNALNAAGDSTAFIQELQRAGYATDPRYAEKIRHIVNNYLRD